MSVGQGGGTGGRKTSRGRGGDSVPSGRKMPWSVSASVGVSGSATANYSGKPGGTKIEVADGVGNSQGIAAQGVPTTRGASGAYAEARSRLASQDAGRGPKGYRPQCNGKPSKG
jgi:hypothetical protein